MMVIFLAILSSTARSQDTMQYIDPMHLPVSIRAERITQYRNYPLQIDGRLKWPKEIWEWLIAKSKNICRGDGVVDIVVSIDSVLYEVIAIARNDKMSDLEAIEVGKEYPISLFPFYNYPYTMAYNRNEPIYLDGHVIWINRRKLDSNIYISPNIYDVFYYPTIDPEKKIFELIRYCD